MATTIIFKGKIVGTNKRYKYRTSKILSDEYKEFKEQLGWLAKAARESYEVNADGFFFVDIRYHSRHDTDGFLKGLFDSFEGIIYKNDKQIAGHKCMRDNSLANNTIVVTIEVL